MWNAISKRVLSVRGAPAPPKQAATQLLKLQIGLFEACGKLVEHALVVGIAS